MADPNWTVPHGALDVRIPRTSGRILLQATIVHLNAFIILTYLFTLCPRTRGMRWAEASLRAFLCIQIPEFFLIQLASIALGSWICELKSPRIPAWLSRYSGANAISTLLRDEHIAEIRRSSPLHRLALIIPLAYGSSFAVATYAERYGIGYHAAKDVGMIGLDHRSGWGAAVGLLAGFLAVSYRIGIWVTCLGRDVADNTENGAGLQIIPEEDEEKDHFEGSGLLAQDAAQDIDSFLGFEASWERKACLFELLIATIIHQIPLGATHRATTLISLLAPVIVMAMVGTIVACRSTDTTQIRKVERFLLFISAIIAIWTIIESTFRDVDELKKAEYGQIHPWSVRWKVTDRFDRILREFV